MPSSPKTIAFLIRELNNANTAAEAYKAVLDEKFRAFESLMQSFNLAVDTLAYYAQGGTDPGMADETLTLLVEASAQQRQRTVTVVKSLEVSQP